MITLGILALKPRTFLMDGCLVIETPVLLRLLLFGVYRRTVVVDPAGGCMRFTRRWFGWKRTRTVLIPEIERLDYSYDDWGSDGRDSTEWFTIKIILVKEREEIVVCRYIGEDGIDWDLGWEGLPLACALEGARGDQQERSLGMVKLLQAMTGLPLV